ncbi:solute carrier family 25 member 45-like [Artemia franciscana]|uniref:Uncharacterized protein n=1 Tax=Artemia franciscana TaxID=6661 RepID=A0AA88HHN6_ARTSF|nr:hypothetical protein QYM36_015386 [Artemia franciscana]KAK2707675.1 hypothetical protein QYM36_015386 [Artemia franciscana]KAK2707676.1 hypothetical protein QYM36_015386 [Artemia franciscana]
MANEINGNFWKDFFAGSIGGGTGVIVGHPLDTIKVRQQALGERSSWQCLVKTFKYEGVRGFFKGMTFPIISNGVFNSIFFGVYASTLRLFHDSSPSSEKPSYTSVYLAGCIGGAAQLTVACPVDLIKIRLQSQTGLGSNSKIWKNHYESNLKGPISCIREIVRTCGVKGLYRGLSIMCLRDIPSFGIYVVTYDVITDIFKSKGFKEEAGVVIIAGGLAGSISWASILPLDVIKSKLQADSPIDSKYKGIIHCAISCYKSEGYTIFGRGFLMMMIRAFPTNAATFWAYKASLDLIN